MQCVADENINSYNNLPIKMIKIYGLLVQESQYKYECQHVLKLLDSDLCNILTTTNIGS